MCEHVNICVLVCLLYHHYLYLLLLLATYILSLLILLLHAILIEYLRLPNCTPVGFYNNKNSFCSFQLWPAFCGSPYKYRCLLHVSVCVRFSSWNLNNCNSWQKLNFINFINLMNMQMGNWLYSINLQTICHFNLYAICAEFQFSWNELCKKYQNDE